MDQSASDNLEDQVPGKNVEGLLYEPRPGFFPIPAVCFDLDLCEHKAQCPVIYVKQEFLLTPEKYSPYWSVTQDAHGNFIVKSSHHFGEPDETGQKPERTFIWKVTDKFDATQECFIAMWVD
ncbi:MAG TPA: hypothetical protein VHA52_10530 [Candidatus Babeliaceae bacterium]|nr:hypothetical protein [Candidatus Babeliaceae bacterium]